MQWRQLVVTRGKGLDIRPDAEKAREKIVQVGRNCEEQRGFVFGAQDLRRCARGGQRVRADRRRLRLGTR